jgi:hypothetical protein
MCGLRVLNPAISTKTKGKSVIFVYTGYGPLWPQIENHEFRSKNISE